ncbi:hypothetical protein A3844_11490 [Paenibacillus helianthi]|uniref:Uncharacterized protein n=1 Tax=Paenibacillus helianthi TaxID=1349432 RepID=A0ABX3EQ96_9BACL|nr:hypothetical protein A3848_29235 [Paenibacillus sp. P32E]OKP87108.1 hypothetical protein A3844_11490 [Paenibacillus helianthi]
MGDGDVAVHAEQATVAVIEGAIADMWGKGTEKVVPGSSASGKKGAHTCSMLFTFVITAGLLRRILTTNVIK